MAAHVTYWGGASYRIGSTLFRKGRTVTVHDDDIIEQLDNDHRFTVERFVAKIIRKPVGEKTDVIDVTEDPEPSGTSNVEDTDPETNSEDTPESEPAE